jgi:streptogramin lyase
LQGPKPNVRCPRGRWLDAALAVTLIAAAVMVVMIGRASRPAAARANRASTAAAPALLPSTVRTRIPLPFGQPGDMTVLGSTAWISDWSASQVVGVDPATKRVIRTVQVGDQQDQPISMTSGAGSLWVLDYFGALLRINPSSGAITKRFPVLGLGADVAYGDGFIWMITDEPNADGGQEYLYKIDPSRDVIVKAAPIPGSGLACAAFPGPHGIWIGCASADYITLIDQSSLRPVQSLRVDSGGFTPQIIPGQKNVWVLTPSALARADPATATITAIIHVAFAPSALSAPALIRDPAGRLWITGARLAVVVPGTLTAYPVACTPNLISAAPDGLGIWLDTGPVLVRLQLDTPTPGYTRHITK